MKKLLTTALVLMAALCPLCTFAQAQFTEPLPLDPQVRKGVLPNGLTYYIRHNETPKGQADFYIAQKVGSILEDDNQRGLAHFLEHMCFNGTQSFPGNSLVEWLESKGVKFGANLNAYTAVDQTVYNISNVPTASEAVQDSCLIILHDWADGLLLDPEEIEKERGVIHQEWRTTNVGQNRILTNLLPKMYPESKYAYRMPIGTIEVIDNFPPQALRDYYETWYRPDQQGVIVVGDIDVDRIEAKIKELFEPIQMPENPKTREYEEVMDTDGTIFAIGSDKEMQYPLLALFFKTETVPTEQRNTMMFMLSDYMTNMISSMLNARFQEMMSNPETPFAQAFASYDDYLLAQTEDALQVMGVAKGDDLIPTFKSIYRELLRAARGGFTITEYDRARQEYLSRLEKAYNNRETVESEKYSRELVQHFLRNDATPGIETEYQLMTMLANQIPVDAINQTMPQLITPDNRVVMAMLPENGTFRIPTEEEMAQAMAEVDAEDIEAFVDEMKDEPLVAYLPKPGKIVEEKELAQWGATELTLSNGVKVVVKPTDFKADQILFDAQALGGTSTISDAFADELLTLPIALQSNSLGTYTSKDLQKYLQGKQASVSLTLSDYQRDVNGNTTPKDLPTLMELIYMTFTGWGLDEAEYAATQQMYEGILKNQEANPQFIFQRDLMKRLSNNPRKQMLSADNINAADRVTIEAIVNTMTNNAADYTFFFVGNIDMDTFRPLVEQYIATLPANAQTATKAPELLESLKVAPGAPRTMFTTAMETPQTYVAVLEYGTLPYTAKTRAEAAVAGQILSARLLKTVREEMGAVYSIWASCQMDRLEPEENVVLQSVFPMKPELLQETLKVIANEVKDMETNISAEELGKVTEYMLKNVAEQREKNEGWLNGMAGAALNGVDTFNTAEEIYKAMTPADIQNFMKNVNSQGNYLEIVLEPDAASLAKAAAAE